MNLYFWRTYVSLRHWYWARRNAVRVSIKWFASLQISWKEISYHPMRCLNWDRKIPVQYASQRKTKARRHSWWPPGFIWIVRRSSQGIWCHYAARLLIQHTWEMWILPLGHKCQVIRSQHLRKVFSLLTLTITCINSTTFQSLARTTTTTTSFSCSIQFN